MLFCNKKNNNNAYNNKSNSIGTKPSFFCSKKRMEDYLNKYYPSFSQQFELLKHIKNGSSGYIYKGQYKCGYNNKKCAIKFYIKKKRKEKKKKKEK